MFFSHFSATITKFCFNFSRFLIEFQGKTLQDSAAAASRKAPEEDYNYAASANTTRSQPSQQPQPPPTPHQQPPPAAAEMSISEYLTKLASSESSGPQPSSHQASSYSSGYVPGMDQPPPPLPGMDHQPPYQQPGEGSASSNENSWNWMRPEETPNGNRANPQQQPPPPSQGAWGSESVPPTALVWPPPRPDPWAASIQPQQVCSLKMTLRWRHLSKEIETHLTCMRPK